MHTRLEKPFVAEHLLSPPQGQPDGVTGDPFLGEGSYQDLSLLRDGVGHLIQLACLGRRDVLPVLIEQGGATSRSDGKFLSVCLSEPVRGLAEGAPVPFVLGVPLQAWACPLPLAPVNPHSGRTLGLTATEPATNACVEPSLALDGLY